MFKKTERNFDNIQFTELRKKIDKKFNDVHDELSECYYDKKPFRDYGILTKEVFDKLHGLIFTMRDVKFHEENLKQPQNDRIPEEKYNEIKDKDGNVIGKKNDKAVQKITESKSEGLEINV